MNRIIVCILLLLAMSRGAWATTYYVSFSGGNDSNNGLTTTTAWKTLDKVQANLGSGNTYLFLNGDTWNARTGGSGLGLIQIGSPKNNMMFGTYGTSSNKPIFDGSSGTYSACFDSNGGDSGATPPFQNITIDGFECRNTSTWGIRFHDYSGNTSGPGIPGIVVKNMYIHDTGPGAFAGATQGPNGTSAACASSTPYGPCDNGSYDNQLMFLDEDRHTDGTIFQNNTVFHCGGHNCIQIHGDGGSPQLIDNQCWDWQHNCIDVKDSLGVLFDGNTVHGVADVANGGIANGSALYFEDDATGLPNPTVTFQRNVAYDVYTGIQCVPSVSGMGTTYCKAYNNTLHLTSSNSAIAGTDVTTNGLSTSPTLSFDVRNNIFDTTSPLHVCGTNNNNSCGQITTWDYNDDGGTAGSISLVVQGPHDLNGADPLYVNASAHNFQLTSGSPVIRRAQANLVDSMTDMGAFQFVGSASGATSAWSLRLF